MHRNLEELRRIRRRRDGDMSDAPSPEPTLDDVRREYEPTTSPNSGLWSSRPRAMIRSRRSSRRDGRSSARQWATTTISRSSTCSASSSRAISWPSAPAYRRRATKGSPQRLYSRARPRFFRPGADSLRISGGAGDAAPSRRFASVHPSARESFDIRACLVAALVLAIAAPAAALGATTKVFVFTAPVHPDDGFGGFVPATLRDSVQDIRGAFWQVLDLKNAKTRDEAAMIVQGMGRERSAGGSTACTCMSPTTGGRPT